MTSQSVQGSRELGDILTEMTFEFFGSGQHKISLDPLLSKSGAVILDVRSSEEVQTLSLPRSGDMTVLHIPTNEIPDRFSEIPTDRPVAVFCSAGIRAAIVYAYLRTLGFERVRILKGGLADLAEQAKPGKLWKRLGDRGQSS